MDDESKQTGEDKKEKIRISKKIKEGFLNDEPKKSEYVFAVIVNIIIFYIANNLLYWNLSFITPNFSQVLWAINLAIGVTIVGNILFLIYDPSWFRHSLKAVMNVFSFLAVYTLYSVFPFSFSQNFIAISVVIILILIMIGIFIAIGVELLKLFIGRSHSNHS